MFLSCEELVEGHPQEDRDVTILKFPSIKYAFLSFLGSIPTKLNNITWGFPGEISNLHSLAHSSIACDIICMILIISSIFVPDFQIALLSANCERSTLCLISRASCFCLRECPDK